MIYFLLWSFLSLTMTQWITRRIHLISNALDTSIFASILCSTTTHTSLVSGRQIALTATNMKACPSLEVPWRNFHFCGALPLKKLGLKSIRRQLCHYSLFTGAHYTFGNKGTLLKWSYHSAAFEVYKLTQKSWSSTSIHSVFLFAFFFFL